MLDPIILVSGDRRAGEEGNVCGFSLRSESTECQILLRRCHAQTPERLNENRVSQNALHTESATRARCKEQIRNRVVMPCTTFRPRDRHCRFSAAFAVDLNSADPIADPLFADSARHLPAAHFMNSAV